jgi:hypothetical protein
MKCEEKMIINGEVGKDLKRGGHGLFEDIILAFSWRDSEKT